MKVEKEKTGASRWSLTIEVPPEESQTELESELKKLRATAVFPGFRKGKVPISLIRQRYAKSLEADLLRDRMPGYYEQALKEADIGEPVAAPEIDLVQFETGKPLIFKATVEVEPAIELAPYDGLTVVRERTEVGDEEVEKQIERLRQRHAVIHDDPQPAGAESLLEVDLQELDAGYVPIIGRKREEVTIDLGRSAPDFRDSLLGIKAGESRNVSTIRPPLSPKDEKKHDYFKVSVKTVKRKEVPELRDDFAGQVSPELKDLDALREEVRKQLQVQVESISFRRMAHLLTHQVVDNTRLDVPDTMLKNYIDRLVENARKNAERTSAEKFDEKFIRDQYRGRAIWNLRWYLIRKKIAEKEGLRVDEQEWQKEYELIAQASGKKVKQIQAFYADEKRRSQLEDDIMERKILQFLISKARVIEKTVSFEEFFAKENGEHEAA